MTALEVILPADIRLPLERANGVQIVKTAAALAECGVATTLIVRRSDPRPTPELLALYGVSASERLRVRRLRVGHRRGAFAVPRALFLLEAGAAVATAWRRGAVAFTRDLQLADLLLRFPQAQRGALVYEAHAVEAVMYRERGQLYGTGARPDAAKTRRIERREARVWRRATAIVTTTAGIRDAFCETHGPRSAVAVIANGCDVPASRTAPDLPADPSILYAGQLYPWKGADVLVEALAHTPQAAHLVIAGGLEGERDLERIRALVGRLDLGERVRFLGTIPQAAVAAELAKARVVAAPFLATAMTERHTSPLKVFEAMAAGRAIVASDLPSSREVLRDGESALLVPPGDARALGAALTRLFGDTGLAERLARRAFADAARYSWPARARQLAQLFEAVR